jgi:hypothetical protein
MVQLSFKKSAIEDTFFVLVVLLGLALFFVVLGNVSDIITPKITTALSGASDQTIVNVTTILEQSSGTTRQYNTLFPFIFIGLLGFALFAGGFVGDSPLMIFLGVIVVGVAVLLGVVYANIFQEISTSENFASTNADFPILNYFMQYLPFIIFIVAFAVVIFVLVRKGGGGGGI